VKDTGDLLPAVDAGRSLQLLGVSVDCVSQMAFPSMDHPVEAVESPLDAAVAERRFDAAITNRLDHGRRGQGVDVEARGDTPHLEREMRVTPADDGEAVFASQRFDLSAVLRVLAVDLIAS